MTKSCKRLVQLCPTRTCKQNIKCYKMLKWQKWTLKNYLCIRTQKVCPSMPSFVSAVLFIPSFNVLSCYFYDSLNLVAVPTAWILTNFGTQLLYNVTLLTFATNNSPQLNSLVAIFRISNSTEEIVSKKMQANSYVWRAT